ncbi:DUF7133 domain-containing protein [Hufsiella ginkgonis]|uniref:C-type cytochrome n=1 Tax=Hufsiella ginkgonis TaxID=2695274 RepID=A0A7K1Y465_9SPHI|nr:c-type cytochrome [Hufsiella ginkgonis]MXV17657.1 c-type cytochrome [Hufsiella ginkgonis]
MKLLSKKSLVYAATGLTIFTLHQCHTVKPAATVAAPATPAVVPVAQAAAAAKPVKYADTVDVGSAAVLTPAESMAKIKIEPGFEVKLVASEPIVSTPVAMTFDASSRMWVIEMTGYMPDTLGTGEDQPSGKVVILEDADKDGVADKRKVVIDSLRLPRAICLIGKGVLVAEPPYLWYYPLNGDKAGKRVLVDPLYTEEGNVEHQPNGLYRALDNWIYNAKSTKRYRKYGDRWVMERTHFRGQWGISQDNYGRLYSNDNSTNLRGDYFSPGLGSGNKNFTDLQGFDENVVRDNRVYPARPTTGVNRGYLPGVLDDSLRLVNFTAACGPLVYRGGLFGPAYEWNTFVAEPSANLIKRNILTNDGYTIKGTQAYNGREFIASKDERFRPVSLYDAPDGALYVVDMYRGIIQHKTYLSPYIKKEIAKRNLSVPLSCGRIYKVVPEGKNAVMRQMPADPKQLVALLGDANGWVRDRAQQMLVDGKSPLAIPALREALKSNDNQFRVMHALWTLEGLHALRTAEVLTALNSPEWPVQMQALSVIPSVVTKISAPLYLAALQKLELKKEVNTAPYIAFACNAIRPFNQVAADKLLQTLVKSYPANGFVADAVISNLQDREAAFRREMTRVVPDTTGIFYAHLGRLMRSIENARRNHDPVLLQKEFPRGAAIFSSTCQTCHGADANGIKSLAPPLNKSEWVNGDKDKLLSIVLFGLTGPVMVNSHLYQAPEITADMPGIGNNKEFSDQDIAQLLSYIRRSWQNNASRITAKDVADARTRLKGREKAFTMKELTNQ